MMESLALDVLLALMLLGYTVYGFREGLSRSAFVIAGVLAGIVGAFFLAPVVSSWVAQPFLRLAVTIGVSIGLIVLGHALGAAIGRGARRGIGRSALSGIDRVLGAIVTGIVAALVASLVGSSVAQLGVTQLTAAVNRSAVLTTIRGLTPDPVEALLAQVRAVVQDSGIPIISGVQPGGPAVIPDIDTGNAALNTAAASVVKISGNAYACGRSQTGTGFIVADDRVVTNAHVVAGVSEPTIEASGATVSGVVVYFDPVDDLAVIYAPDLTAPPLAVAATLPAGSDAAVQGYPNGGPFSSGPARVLSVAVNTTTDIYDDAAVDRELYTLAADVRSGNSGGPLLTLDGEVVGVVFARSGNEANVGYAMTMTELDPVLAAAGALTEPTSSGECIPG